MTSTAIQENDIPRQNLLNKAKSATAKIKEALANHKIRIKENQKERKKIIQIDDRDVMLDKTMWALIEDLLNDLREHFGRSNVLNLHKELKKNEKLSKEFIISSIQQKLAENEDLSQEQKNLTLMRLSQDKLQTNIEQIVNYKANQYQDHIKFEQDRILKQNPTISKEELTERIIDSLKELQMRGAEMVEALDGSSFKQITEQEHQKDVTPTQTQIPNVRKV